MSIRYGASRAFNYPEDKNSQADKYDAPPVAATASVWHGIIDMAAAGNPLAKKVHSLGRAINAKRIATAEGTAVPTWAREILGPIEDDESNGLDEAIAALSRAIN